LLFLASTAERQNWSREEEREGRRKRERGRIERSVGESHRFCCAFLVMNRWGRCVKQGQGPRYRLMGVLLYFR